MTSSEACCSAALVVVFGSPAELSPTGCAVEAVGAAVLVSTCDLTELEVVSPSGFCVVDEPAGAVDVDSGLVSARDEDEEVSGAGDEDVLL